MAETYFPFDAGTGANTTEDGWAKMARFWLRTGVLRGELNELAVSATGGAMQVNIAAGRAWIEGFFYENDAVLGLPIGAADPANPRRDRIVLRLDRAANSIHAVVLPGVPAAVPVAPAATYTAATWDLTLATVLVPAASVVVAPGNVADARSYAAPGLDRYDLRSGVDTPSDVGFRRTGANQAQVDGALAVTGLLSTQAITAGGVVTANAGLVVAAGGVDVQGGPTPGGYTGGEIRFPAAGSGLQLALTTLSIGAPRMFFDHRGAGNTGDWYWRNGSGGGSPRMGLSGAGELSIGVGGPLGGGYRLSVFGTPGANAPLYVRSDAGASADGTYQIGLANGGDPVGFWAVGASPASSGSLRFAYESGGGPVAKLTIDNAGSLTATGRITAGQVGSVAFIDNDAHSWEGNGTGQWVFRNAWNSTNAYFRFFGGVGANELGRIAADGAYYASGSSSRFGQGSMGAAFPYLRVGNEGDSANAYLIADGTSIANVGVIIRPKGTNSVSVQTDLGATMLTITQKGHLIGGNGPSGAPVASAFFAGAFGLATAFGSDTAGVVALNSIAAPANVPFGNTICHITFANPFTNAPSVVVQPFNGSNGYLSNAIAWNVTTTGFDIINLAAWTPGSNSVLRWSWQAISY